MITPLYELKRKLNNNEGYHMISPCTWIKTKSKFIISNIYAIRTYCNEEEVVGPY